jgi:pilus assembly protein CpaD
MIPQSEVSMSMRTDRNFLCVAKIAAPLALAAVLAACSSTSPVLVGDVYAPPLHYQRYPIEVAKGTVKLDVSTASARLTAAQEDAIARFAQQARASTSGYVVVRRPGGNVTADVVAGRITQILADQGIAAENQVQSTYRGNKGAPVMVAFQRSFATTQECGDWSQELARSGANEPYPNFGCAQQHNIAAMVADPQDFEQPRTATASDAMRRNQVITDYRTPKNTATPVDDQAKITVSDVK